jgi:hypothetical protein|tara:strand:+ start:3795 stop:4217 length:423 start_codon:yes stop_codon:yes gene_type:complete
MLHSKDKFLEDEPAKFDGQFFWDYLNVGFQRGTGRNIRFMDIDAHVEIGGQHMVIETKREGVLIPKGQKKALLQLWAKGYHMVVFLWGKKDPIECEIHWPSGTKTKIYRGQLTKKKLVGICERWARWADKNPAPFKYEDS